MYSYFFSIWYTYINTLGLKKSQKTIKSQKYLKRFLWKPQTCLTNYVYYLKYKYVIIYNKLVYKYLHKNGAFLAAPACLWLQSALIMHSNIHNNVLDFFFSN